MLWVWLGGLEIRISLATLKAWVWHQFWGCVCTLLKSPTLRQNDNPVFSGFQKLYNLDQFVISVKIEIYTFREYLTINTYLTTLNINEFVGNLKSVTDFIKQTLISVRFVHHQIMDCKIFVRDMCYLVVGSSKTIFPKLSQMLSKSTSTLKITFSVAFIITTYIFL